MKSVHRIFSIILLAVALFATASTASAYDRNGRDCRNYIVAGNRLFNEKRYAEAEVQYQKALQANPTSQVASFNLASTYLRQGKIEDLNDSESPMSKALRTFTGLCANPQNSTVAPHIIEKSFYNLGNIAFNQQNYAQAINMYKSALRIDPADNLARENLRLAQLRLKQQQDKQNPENKDQDKKDQDKKDQDKKDQDKNDQDKKGQPQPPKENEKKPEPQQQQPQGGISDENAAKILQTMENEEAATRRRIESQRGRQHAGRRATGNPW